MDSGDLATLSVSVVLENKFQKDFDAFLSELKAHEGLEQKIKLSFDVDESNLSESVKKIIALKEEDITLNIKVNDNHLNKINAKSIEPKESDTEANGSFLLDAGEYTDHLNSSIKSLNKEAKKFYNTLKSIDQLQNFMQDFDSTLSFSSDDLSSINETSISVKELINSMKELNQETKKFNTEFTKTSKIKGGQKGQNQAQTRRSGTVSNPQNEVNSIRRSNRGNSLTSELSPFIMAGIPALITAVLASDLVKSVINTIKEPIDAERTARKSIPGMFSGSGLYHQRMVESRILGGINNVGAEQSEISNLQTDVMGSKGAALTALMGQTDVQKLISNTHMKDRIGFTIKSILKHTEKENISPVQIARYLRFAGLSDLQGVINTSMNNKEGLTGLEYYTKEDKAVKYLKQQNLDSIYNKAQTLNYGKVYIKTQTVDIAGEFSTGFLDNISNKMESVWDKMHSYISRTVSQNHTVSQHSNNHMRPRIQR